MKEFSFNGEWESEYTFDAFKGFRYREQATPLYESSEIHNGLVDVIIKDELSDDPDPSISQLNAINYLIDHPQEIQQLLLKTLEKKYPDFKYSYGYDPDDEDDQLFFPTTNSLDDYKQVCSPISIYVFPHHYDNYAYIGICCYCTWDEEHGLGFMTHKNEVLEVWGMDVAFQFKIDGKPGTVRIPEDGSHLPKPKKYEPHPKYGQLKPSQVLANEEYEMRLLRQGFHDDFIQLIKSGEIDIKDEKTFNRYLSKAVNCSQVVVEYMLSLKPEAVQGLIFNCIWSCNRDMVAFLLTKGADINEQNSRAETMLTRTEKYIEQYGKSKYYQSQIGELKLFKDWLISKGAK